MQESSRMPFDLQPILKSTLLVLRPLQAEDFDDLYEVASDPLIWAQHPVKNRYKEELFRLFFTEALDSSGTLITIDLKTNQVIGSSRYHGYDEQKSVIEIGWSFLAQSHWGGTYNREMKNLMLRHAFRFVNSVIFLVGSENIRSKRAVEKIGGIHVGSSLDTGGHDSLIYQITASTFTPILYK
jgi:RimJ/RimL family protein N-acetyltransferase